MCVARARIARHCLRRDSSPLNKNSVMTDEDGKPRYLLTPPHCDAEVAPSNAALVAQVWQAFSPPGEKPAGNEMRHNDTSVDGNRVSSLRCLEAAVPLLGNANALLASCLCSFSFLSWCPLSFGSTRLCVRVRAHAHV